MLYCVGGHFCSVSERNVLVILPVIKETGEEWINKTIIH